MKLSGLAAIAAITLSLTLVSDLSGQEDPSKIKPLAPGILKVIPAEIDPRDSYTRPMAIPGLDLVDRKLNYSPQKSTLKAQASDVIFFRNVWQYELAFTGLRQTRVIMKYPDGTQKSENVWYMVIRYRDTGRTLNYKDIVDDREIGPDNKLYVQKDGKSFTVEPVDVDGVERFLMQEDATGESFADQERKFLPQFSLEGWVKGPEGDYSRVSYLNTNEPALTKFVQSIEDPNLKLLTKEEITKAEIPIAQSELDPGVWGVAIWRNVDPRIDYVSVNVSGLTNAYRISKGENGMEFAYKTLQLNFWRPGDEVAQDRDDVVYGIPLVDGPRRQIEICRRYNMPAPVLRGYEVSERADTNVLVTELDAQVNMIDFTSALVAQLDSGTLPEELKQAFAGAGVNLPADASLDIDPDATVAGSPAGIPGERWIITTGGKKYVIQYEPQVWRKDGNGIEFIKSLDHFWIYR